MSRPRLSLSLLFTLFLVLAFVAVSDDAARGSRRGARCLTRGACSRAASCPPRARPVPRAASFDVRHANPAAVPHAFTY